MSGEIAVGRVIAARYQLEQRLGVGGMGSVWRAIDRTLGSPVAIKLIDPELLAYPDVRARFYAEARAAAALRSPQVVQILDYGVDDALPFIAMELLEGETLATRLERGGAIEPARLLAVFSDVGRALRKAHEAGVVHRDLKPDNIFLVQNDDDEIAKILDFGIAKTVNAGAQSGNTSTGAMLGTLPYMSPEQAQGTKVVDHRTDLWALGVIAFECLCGKRPFDSDAAGDLVLQICAHPLPVPSRVASVPPAFDAWFARAANRDPEQRFQSARELVESLREVLLPSLSDTVPAAPPRRALRGPVAAATAEAPLTMSGAKAPRRPTPMILALVGGAAALVAALLFWGLGSRTAPVLPAAPPASSASASSASPTVSPAGSAAPAPSALPTGEPVSPLVAASAAPDSKAAKRPVEPPVKPADKAPVRSTATPPGTSGPGSRDSRIGF